MLTNSGLIYIGDVYRAFVSKSANGKSTLTLASLGKATTIDNKHLWAAGGGGGSHSFYQAGWSTLFMPNIHPNIDSIGKWQPTPSASTIGKFHAPPIKCKTKYIEQVSILTNAPPLHSSCL